jgi:hypothetical protein
MVLDSVAIQTAGAGISGGPSSANEGTASMADTHDDYTGWTPFFKYVQRRAARIVPVTARAGEAQRLTLDQVLRRELELSWRDVDGREYVGLPVGFSGWSAYYDLSADAIREFPFGGRTLYEPRVREPRRKLANPVDTTATDPQQVIPPPAPSSPISVEPPTSLANTGEGGEHDDLVKLDEPTDQWPWHKDLTLRQKDGSEPRRIQMECEKNLKPEIQHLSTAKICKALEKAGVSDASDSSVRRAFGHK